MYSVYVKIPSHNSIWLVKNCLQIILAATCFGASHINTSYLQIHSEENYKMRNNLAEHNYFKQNQESLLIQPHNDNISQY